MALHPGIPPQKGTANFGLDGSASEDYVTSLSQKKEKKPEVLRNDGTSFSTMLLSQQMASLKYSPFKAIRYERGPQTEIHCALGATSSVVQGVLTVIYLLLPGRHISLGSVSPAQTCRLLLISFAVGTMVSFLIRSQQLPGLLQAHSAFQSVQEKSNGTLLKWGFSINMPGRRKRGGAVCTYGKLPG